MNVLFLEHAQHDGPLNLAKWARDRGHSFATTRFYDGESPGEIPDLLVVLGGSMAAYSEKDNPWLVEEKRFIASSIAAGAKVLGVCLGAQLVAAALGARVYKHPVKEIGWHAIELTVQGLTEPVFEDFPRAFPVLHWHGDTFELPKEARLLATSRGCAHQAFAIGDRILGVQFHVEVSRDAMASWLAHGAEDFTGPGPFVQSPKEILAAPFYDELEARMRAILDRFSRD